MPSIDSFTDLAIAIMSNVLAFLLGRSKRKKA